MKTLLLMRHAKSSWADSQISDFDRPLNERGEMAAPFMGEFLVRNGLEPYVVISSPALRARSTAQLVKKAGNLDAPILFEERIYEASPNTLRQAVADIDDAYPTAMLIGHNPGLEGLIRYLTGFNEPMPTAAVAVIELDIEMWTAVDDGVGTLKKIYRPREEMGMLEEAAS